MGDEGEWWGESGEGWGEEGGRGRTFSSQSQ